jgi:hypothetical protein
MCVGGLAKQRGCGVNALYTSFMKVESLSLINLYTTNLFIELNYLLGLNNNIKNSY